jgi:NDP-sugar pyrophosphorylase family protein
MIVLAGGMGTRLGDLGISTPKILIPINKRPFLDLQLDWLIRNGVTDITYCLGHLGSQIENHISTLVLPPEVKIDLCWDGQTPLGTGAAVTQAAKKIDGKFLVTYGDSYLRADLSLIAESFVESDLSAMMVIFKNRNKYGRSNVEVVNKIVTHYEKNHSSLIMEYIDYGIVGFDQKIISKFHNKSRFDLSEIVKLAVQQKQLLGIEIKERFFEIGSLQGIDELEKHLAAEK